MICLKSWIFFYFKKYYFLKYLHKGPLTNRPHVVIWGFSSPELYTRRFFRSWNYLTSAAVLITTHMENRQHAEIPNKWWKISSYKIPFPHLRFRPQPPHWSVLPGYIQSRGTRQLRSQEISKFWTQPNSGYWLRLIFPEVVTWKCKISIGCKPTYIGRQCMFERTVNVMLKSWSILELLRLWEHESFA